MELRHNISKLSRDYLALSELFRQTKQNSIVLCDPDIKCTAAIWCISLKFVVSHNRCLLTHTYTHIIYHMYRYVVYILYNVSCI